MTIHDAATVAFHEHSRAVSIVIAPGPPDAPKLVGVVVAVTAHLLDALGARTLVVVVEDEEHAAARRPATIDNAIPSARMAARSSNRAAGHAGTRRRGGGNIDAAARIECGR